MIWLFERFFAWISAHATVLSAVVGAAATVVVARFTVVLANVTGEQARLTREAIELSRKEFTSTHRPKIIARKFEIEDKELPEGKEVGAWFQAQNIGETPAHIWEINTKTLLANINEMPGSILLDHRTAYNITLSGGEPSEIFMLDHSLVPKVGQSMRVYAEEWGLYFVGVIRYRDDNGTERETGFCRRWDMRRNNWEVVDSPDYEYGF